MVNLNWCKKQKAGIKLVEPNENLSKEYLLEAENTLKSMKEIETETNVWKATKKYYFEYFLIYSFLMKVGIKCEIHDCTIELIKILERKEYLPKGTYSLLKKDKELRVDNQYYLKNKNVKLDFNELSNFYLKIKELINSLTQEKIKDIRNFFNELLK